MVEEFLSELLRTKSCEPLTRMMSAHLFSGGKRVRSNLILKCVEALGGDCESAIGAAAACELLHNATLIHDDVQDGDRVRRGGPTVWVTDGINQAINAGDMMLLLPLSAIAQMPVADSLKWKISLCLSEAAQKVVSGQALEPELYSHIHSDNLFDKYLECIEGKTASLFGYAIQCACMISNKTRIMDTLSLDFIKIGLLFQMQDDVLDLYGDKGRGRRGEDLREAKISMLVVQHLKLHPRDEELISFLKAARKNSFERNESSQIAIDKWIERFKNEGALKETLQFMKVLVEDIRSSPFIRQEPKIKTLVDDLIDKILKPIGEVWETSPEVDSACRTQRF